MSRVFGIVTANYGSQALGNLTANRPAASLPIGGRYRLVDFALSSLVNSGITTVGLITPVRGRSLLDHVGVGNAWDLSRKVGGLFILPGSVYGVKTPGSRFLLRDLIQNREILDRADEEYVLLTTCDWMYNIDFRDMIRAHTESGADVTLLYRSDSVARGPGHLYLDLNEAGDVTALRDEGTNCFMGAFLISLELLRSFLEWYGSADHFDLVSDVFRGDVGRMQIRGWRFDDYAGCVTSVEEYQRVNQDILRYAVRRQVFRRDRPIRTKIQDSTPAKYGPCAAVHRALIPSGCSIGGTVENSVLFRGAEVAPGAVVRNCVLMQRAKVGPGAVLENVICDKGVTFHPGARVTGSGKPVVIGKDQEI